MVGVQKHSDLSAFLSLPTSELSASVRTEIAKQKGETNTWNSAEGSKRNRKRVGRGPASGNGKTAGRGMNGQKSRAGGGKGAGFEGGQTPLARRLPKLPGFRNFNRVEYVPVNVSRLDAKFNAGDLVDADTLYAAGIIKNTTDPIKVLGDG